MGTLVPISVVDAWWRAANYLSVGQNPHANGEDLPEIPDWQWLY